jgi:hypothetical protein
VKLELDEEERKNLHSMALSLAAIVDLLAKLDDTLGQIVQVLTPPPDPATILLTDSQGVPVSLVSLTGTQTSTVTVVVADDNGNPISGDVLDAGSGTVTVSDSTICTAAFTDPTQSAILVTALNATGSATVTVGGTCQGITLTDFGGPLDVATQASAPVPATIVLTPGAPQGS